MLFAVALLLSALIGITLGLLGGGGSILTVPILAYVVGVEPKQAIVMSLVVVGLTSVFATVQHGRAGNVRWGIGLVFGGTAMVGAWGGGWVAQFISGTVLLLLFGGMMLVTAVAMLRKKPGKDDADEEDEPKPDTRSPLLRWGLVVVEGVLVGGFTGLVGAGGGFLVVPALVLLGKLPMRQAVGTSLFVISLKSFAGAGSYLQHVELDWGLTLAVSGAAIVGTFVGSAFAKKVPQATLKRAFGWFVVVMGVFILGKELSGMSPVTSALSSLPLALWLVIGAVVIAGAVAVTVTLVRKRVSTAAG